MYTPGCSLTWPGPGGKQAVRVRGWGPGLLSPLRPSLAAPPISLCAAGEEGRRGACSSRGNALCIFQEAPPFCCVYAGASAHRNPVINQSRLSWESEGPGQRPASYPGSLGCSLQPQAPGREAGDAQLSSSLLPRRPWVADSFQCPHQAEPGPLRPR